MRLCLLSPPRVMAQGGPKPGPADTRTHHGGRTQCSYQPCLDIPVLQWLADSLLLNVRTLTIALAYTVALFLPP